MLRARRRRKKREPTDYIDYEVVKKISFEPGSLRTVINIRPTQTKFIKSDQEAEVYKEETEELCDLYISTVCIELVNVKPERVQVRFTEDLDRYYMRALKSDDGLAHCLMRALEATYSVASEYASYETE